MTRSPGARAAARGVAARRIPLIATAVAGLASCGGKLGCGDTGLGPCGDSPPTLQMSQGLAVADLNGDGLPDVVRNTSTGANAAGQISLYLHSPGASKSFEAPTSFMDGKSWSSLLTADINGDGLPDIVSIHSFAGGLSVYLNSTSAPGTFTASADLASRGADVAAIADFDGDGAPDIVVGDSQLSLFLQNKGSRGTFAAPVALYTKGAGSIATGDLNGDETPDIAFADHDGVKVLLNTRSAAGVSFAPPISVWTQTANSTEMGVNGVAIADVNGDGLSDLVITDPGPTGGASPFVAVLLQNPSNLGEFLAAQKYSLPADNDMAGASIVIADLDGDGRPDIVVGDPGKLTVLLQDSAHPGSFLNPTYYSAPVDAYVVAVADVDGDGHPDIITDGGATTSEVNGVVQGSPGILFQDAAHPGTFLLVQNLQ